jgi:hypothetical protein
VRGGWWGLEKEREKPREREGPERDPKMVEEKVL